MARIERPLDISIQRLWVEDMYSCRQVCHDFEQEHFTLQDYSLWLVYHGPLTHCHQVVNTFSMEENH